MAAQQKWQLSGDYFENCNCNVVCPCLVSTIAPLVGNHLGVKKVAIKYAITGKSRSAEIPGVMHMAVEPLATMHSSGEIWATIGHPVADKLALGVGVKG